MEHQAVDPWLAVLEIGVLFASVAVWLRMVAAWMRGGAVLEYEPRRAVPWGPVAVLPAMVFVLLALGSGLTTDALPSPDEPVNASQAAQHLLAAMLFQSIVTAAVLGIVAVSDATVRDLGVQKSAHLLTRDFGVGLFACLAAAVPVYGIQGLLLYLLQREDPSHHPLIDMVTDGQPHVGIMFLAAVAAVIVAPICEEITYRLVLQGWLEKWEDEQVGWRTEQQNDEARMTDDEESLTENSSFVIRHSSFPCPPRRGIGGLPYGWVPILVSSALFAAAHFGYGPEPVPIFLLALVLGYVYQRTHRIVPCIVAHGLFNLLTMLALWRMVFHAADNGL